MRREKIKTGTSLTTILAIAFFSLSALVLLIAGGLQIFSNLQTQQAIVFNQQQLIAQEASGTVRSFIQENFNILETASKLVDVSAASTATQEQILGNMMGLQPAFRHAALLDAQGEETARASRLSRSALQQFLGRIAPDIFVQMQRGDRYIGPVYVDEQTSEPLVLMAAPIRNVFGDFQGVVVVEVNLKFIWDLVDQIRVGETGLAYVVDNAGRLIAFRDTARVLRGENVSNLPEVQVFIANPQRVAESTGIYEGIEGVSSVSSFVALGTPEWAVVTELPVREAYQDVIRGALLAAGTTLLMAVIAGIGGFFMARRLSAPLLDLTDTAVRIADGELDLEANVAGAREVSRLANAFNSMTGQLRELIGSLEQRVESRTRALEASTEVGRRLATILDLRQLIAEVVTEIRTTFNYYHVHIYLLDEQEQKLKMAGGTGEAGRSMLASGHSLRLDQGLVGRAAMTQKPVLIPDVSADPTWLPNPLLPETQAETAVPILYGDILLGVLDVQHNVVKGLSDEDVRLLQSVAGQVAIALRNARLYDQVQRQAEQQTIINEIGRQIQTATTVETVLKIATRELTQALGTSRASIEIGRDAVVENGRARGGKF